MSLGETLILATYFFVLVILAVYGWHRYYLVYVYMKHKHEQPTPKASFDALPVVTIQLPLFGHGSVLLSARRSYTDILRTGLYNSIYPTLTGDTASSGVISHTEMPPSPSVARKLAAA